MCFNLTGPDHILQKVLNHLAHCQGPAFCSLPIFVPTVFRIENSPYLLFSLVRHDIGLPNPQIEFAPYTDVSLTAKSSDRGYDFDPLHALSAYHSPSQAPGS